MEHLFSYLYPSVMAISIVGFIPQIRSLLFAKTKPDNISLSTWVMWSFGTFIAFGYAVTNLHDPALAQTLGINFILTVVTALLIAYNRYVRFETRFIFRENRAPALPVKNEIP